MIILVCGGREYKDWRYLYTVLDNIRTHSQIERIIHGDAIGADRLTSMWCKSRGVHVKPYPARWITHGKAAGPIRNQQMLDEGKPDIVVAFPGGVGTSDMIGRARNAGVPVLTVFNRPMVERPQLHLLEP